MNQTAITLNGKMAELRTIVDGAVYEVWTKDESAMGSYRKSEVEKALARGGQFFVKDADFGWEEAA